MSYGRVLTADFEKNFREGLRWKGAQGLLSYRLRVGLAFLEDCHVLSLFSFSHHIRQMTSSSGNLAMRGGIIVFRGRQA